MKLCQKSEFWSSLRHLLTIELPKGFGRDTLLAFQQVAIGVHRFLVGSMADVMLYCESLPIYNYLDLIYGRNMDKWWVAVLSMSENTPSSNSVCNHKNLRNLMNQHYRG